MKKTKDHTVECVVCMNDVPVSSAQIKMYRGRMNWVCDDCTA